MVSFWQHYSILKSEIAWERIGFITCWDGLSLLRIPHGFREVVFGMCLLQVTNGYMGIYLSRFQGFMAEHLLQVPDRCSISQHMGSAGVADGSRSVCWSPPR